MAEKENRSISPALMVTGAVGLGLIIYGLSKIGGPKAAKIKARFTFDHQGPEEDVDLNVAFGRHDGVLQIFMANPDLIKVAPFSVPAHQTPTQVQADVVVTVPATEQAMYFALPFTYDAEAEILDHASGDQVEPNGKVVTQRVFTHTDKFEVIML